MNGSCQWSPAVRQELAQMHYSCNDMDMQT